MKKVLIIAPHVDDETLGCGGFLLKTKNKKIIIRDLLIVTELKRKNKNLNNNKKYIKRIKKLYNFNNIIEFGLPTCELEKVGFGEITSKIRTLVRKNSYDTIFTPFLGDSHTDHYYTTKSVLSACKIFRSPSIKKILMYETISETNLNFYTSSFKPNYYVDISNELKKKIKIAKIFKNEIKKHPFPRSEESIKSLALLRGAECNKKFAESYQIIFMTDE